MSLKLSYILFFLAIFFKSYSQKELVGFKNLEIKSKLEVYNSLSDSIKRVESHFLLKEILKHDTLSLDRRTKFKLNLSIAELDYYNSNYIKSVNKLRSIYSDSYLNLSEKVEVLDQLKKSYYKLHLYPEIFETNSTIKRLIGQGANYPLWSYNMNSRLYGRLNLYKKATIALKEEIRELMKTKNRDSLIIPSAYNDLGFYFFRAKKFDSALVNYNRALSFANQSLKKTDTLNYKRIYAVVKGNIASIHTVKNKYEEAIPLLEESIAIGENTGESLGSIISSYNLLTKCYIETENYSKVRTLLNKEKKLLINSTGLDLGLIDYLRNKALFYSKIKRTDSANYYYQKAFKIKDSIDWKGINQILASNELIYNRAEERKLKKQHIIDLKNQEIEIKNRQKNITIILASLLGMFLLYSLYNSYYLKKSRHDIRLKNNQIKIALKEKEVLLKEVHHRVKNNLQIISGLLELQQVDGLTDEVKILLKEGQNRIQSVAIIHKMMYQSDNVSKVDMKKYLDELLDVLSSSYNSPNKTISANVLVDDIHFDINKAVPLSLIVNEAVCNAYKHAFKGRGEGNISVLIKDLGSNAFLLSIKDNGIGLPNNFNLDSTESIGFDLIDGLSRQLKGKLEIINNSGTELNIVFNNS